MHKPTHYQLGLVTGSTRTDKLPTGNNKGLSQAYQIRDLAANALLELKDAPVPSLEDKVSRASALRSLTYVWQEASERIRIIKGKPMPGSLRPIAKPKKVRLTSTVPLEQLPVDITSTVRTEPDSISTGKAEPPDSIGDKHA